jgi:PGF-CTERM protein
MRVPSPHFAAFFLLLVGAGLAVGPAPAAADGGGNVSLYVVPDDVDDPSGVETAVTDGDAEPAGKLVVGDRLAVVVDSERLASDLEERNGSTTERFFAALEGEADLRVVQTNPKPERATKVVRLGPANASVHRNGSTVYVLVETGELTFERSRSGENEPEPVSDGERYAVTFGYDLEEFAKGGPEVGLYTTASEFIGGPTYTYDPLPPEVLNRSVTVNIEPEGGHFARAALEGGRNVTAPVERVERSDNRGVTLDLRDVEPGTGYVLELVHDGEVVDRHEGTVREPRATLRDVNVTEVDNWTAVNATANLSHGVEVRVLNEDEERLGWTAVPPGNETAVSIELRGSAEELVVRAAREQGAGRAYYEGVGTTIDFSDRQVRDPLSTPTPTPVATESPTATATVTATGTRTDADGDTTTDDQPGFGVGVALAALLAAGLLARRRG